MNKSAVIYAYGKMLDKVVLPYAELLAVWTRIDTVLSPINLE